MYKFDLDALQKIEIRNKWGGYMSQHDIADKTGISQSTVHRLLTGKVSNPKIEDVIALVNISERPENEMMNIIKRA